MRFNIITAIFKLTDIQHGLAKRVQPTLKRLSQNEWANMTVKWSPRQNALTNTYNSKKTNQPTNKQTNTQTLSRTLR
jgi:NADPH-dependent 7-cyano-7-deazaguanine reductase QueF